LGLKDRWIRRVVGSDWTPLASLSQNVGVPDSPHGIGIPENIDSNNFASGHCIKFPSDIHV